MITYVYRKRKTNLLSLSDCGRSQEEDKLLDELLYQIDDISPEHIAKDLRPYQCLWLSPSVVFKNHPDVISYFEGRGYLVPQDIQMTTLSEGEIETKLLEVIDTLQSLNANKVIIINPFTVERNKKLYGKGQKKITYSCDIYNYLSDIYGSDTIDTYLEYKDLSTTKKEILKTLNTIPATERKALYLNTTARDELGDEFEDILKFLPEWYRIRYRLSKFEPLQDIKEPISVECSDSTNLKKQGDITEEELQKKLAIIIYGEFELGKRYSGPEIAEKLREIYGSLGIEKVARIKDLEDYFNVTKINYFGPSEYKLETRK